MTDSSPAMPGTLASWGDRVIAALIDAGIVIVGYIAVFIVSRIFGAVSDALGGLIALLGYLALAVAWYYFGYLEGLRGQSPGKAITGLEVVQVSDGGYMGGGLGVGRKLLHILDGFCLIGYLWPIWDPQRQTFADKVVSTVVVRDREKKSFSIDLLKP